MPRKPKMNDQIEAVATQVGNVRRTTLQELALQMQQCAQQMQQQSLVLQELSKQIGKKGVTRERKASVGDSSQSESRLAGKKVKPEMVEMTIDEEGVFGLELEGSINVNNNGVGFDIQTEAKPKKVTTNLVEETKNTEETMVKPPNGSITELMSKNAYRLDNPLPPPEPPDSGQLLAAIPRRVLPPEPPDLSYSVNGMGHEKTEANLRVFLAEAEKDLEQVEEKPVIRESILIFNLMGLTLNNSSSLIEEIKIWAELEPLKLAHLYEACVQEKNDLHGLPSLNPTRVKVQGQTKVKTQVTCFPLLPYHVHLRPTLIIAPSFPLNRSPVCTTFSLQVSLKHESFVQLQHSPTFASSFLLKVHVSSLKQGFMVKASSSWRDPRVISLKQLKPTESEGVLPHSTNHASTISGFAKQGVCLEAFNYLATFMQWGGANPFIKLSTNSLSVYPDSLVLRDGKEMYTCAVKTGVDPLVLQYTKEIQGYGLRSFVDRIEFWATSLVGMYLKFVHVFWTCWNNFLTFYGLLNFVYDRGKIWGIQTDVNYHKLDAITGPLQVNKLRLLSKFMGQVYQQRNYNWQIQNDIWSLCFQHWDSGGKDIICKNCSTERVLEQLTHWLFCCNCFCLNSLISCKLFMSRS